MMIEAVTKTNLAEYEAFIQKHPKGHFLQSSEWGKVKESWKWEAILCRDDEGRVCGSLAVLIRKVPVLPYTLMYAGRGPVCDSHDEETLRQLTQGAKDLAARYKAYALMMDPDIESDDLEFISIMKKLGYHHKEAGKNFEGVQPNYVFRLDVKDKTEEELMAEFHQKTRYNIRLAGRKGVSVMLCDETTLPQMLPHFARIMKETGQRDGFITRSEEYFANLMKYLGEHARLYMALYNDKPVAGTLAIHFGNKVWYLYGASSNEYRNVMPNYLLQWSMIRWALETGSEIYDFRGVSGDLTPENPLYGLYLFKKGFGGKLTEFCGEFEYLYKPAVNTAVNLGMKTMRGARHALYVAKNRKKDNRKPENEEK
ncbi:lipid II:glycine glycyltransferase FemX [Acidaminobacterium chupaoyuni]